MSAVLTAPAPRSGFGELLRTWRRRRRLTQLDLGIQADVSARHLSFLETGRSRPSREMVLRLAEELGVPLRGRNELLVAAGFAPAYTEHGLDDAELRAVRGSLVRILDGHEPYPAVLVDGRWNLVAGNRAVALLTDLVAPWLLAPPLNVLRASLHPDGLAPHVADLAEYAAHVVSRLRRQVARAADPGLAELLAELTGYVRDAGLDPAAQPRDRIVLPLRLRHPDQELTLFSTVAVLGAPLDVTLEEVAIESFFPADAATARYLRTRFG
ncbi:helix-turn-helix transcriptional regulator [Pseudonocardia hispaniensis]|uniref:Helix-turn-helix transcriptional regulator n=1 Tax=Pseudonocardia hispaniensis TaxID=904933 RepID=A0ABW1J7I4_9PSEU